MRRFIVMRSRHEKLEATLRNKLLELLLQFPGTRPPA
jgi:hypothetical protein